MIVDQGGCMPAESIKVGANSIVLAWRLESVDQRGFHRHEMRLGAKDGGELRRVRQDERHKGGVEGGERRFRLDACLWRRVVVRLLGKLASNDLAEILKGGCRSAP